MWVIMFHAEKNYVHTSKSQFLTFVMEFAQRFFLKQICRYLKRSDW